MSSSLSIKMLEKAKSEFIVLSKNAKYKARIYKTVDIFIKILISLGGAIITYFSDPVNQDVNKVLLRIMGIVITALTAFASVFTFEKRSMSHIQIYGKCQNIIPEIEEKIETNSVENVREYIKETYKELSHLALASFTDSLSTRFIKN